MITEDYVSFEVAKLLKERGYCNISNTLYKDNGEFLHYDVGLTNRGFSTTLGNFYETPTHQMALKWLREVYNIFIQIDYVVLAKTSFEYTYEIHNMCKGRSIAISEFRDNYETYEDAVDAAIKYCLTNLIK